VEFLLVREVLKVVFLCTDGGELRGGEGERRAGMIDAESERPLASTMEKYLPVPHAASRTMPSGGSFDRNVWTNVRCMSSISPH